MILQEHWECVVTEIDSNKITANLYDVLEKDNPEMMAEIPIKNILKEDLDLVQLGGVFDWYIGYKTGEDEAMEAATSVIKFRRNYYTKEEIERAEVKAEKHAELFGVNE